MNRSRNHKKTMEIILPFVHKEMEIPNTLLGLIVIHIIKVGPIALIAIVFSLALITWLIIYLR